MAAPVWACKEHQCAQHDAFINYRVASEAVLAEKIFFKIERLELAGNARPKVFLDKFCLVDGEDWKVGFLSGLNNSRLFLALISVAGIDRIKKADQQTDNVLLEYEMALEKVERGEMAILPLLVGEYVSGKLLKHFSYSEVGPWPDAPHKGSGKNIKATMTALAKLQGIKVDPNAPDACMPEVQKKLEALRKAAGLGGESAPASKGAVDLVADAEAREDELRGIFLRTDVNRDGSLQPDEVSALLASLAMPAGPKEVEAAFVKYDADKDGNLQFEEFKLFYNDQVRRTLEARKGASPAMADLQGAMEMALATEEFELAAGLEGLIKLHAPLAELEAKKAAAVAAKDFAGAKALKEEVDKATAAAVAAEDAFKAKLDWPGAVISANGYVGEPKFNMFNVRVAPGASVQAAVDGVRPGGSVLLLPGVHAGPLVLRADRAPVHIFGRGTATLQAASGVLLTSEAAVATVDGLVLRREAGGENDHCVEIKGGKSGLRLQACDITSAARACVNMSDGASPVVIDCKIHDSNSVGLRVEGAKPRLEANDVWNHVASCVQVTAGGDPIVINNKIHDGQDKGVFIVGSKGRLEGNDIWGNTKHNVVLQEGADPIVINNKIHDGKIVGVLIFDAKGRLEGNDIWGNAAPGIDISEGSDPLVVNNKIHDGQTSGVIFCGAKGRLQGNEIWGNKYNGVEIGTGSDPVLVNNKIHDGLKGGVLVIDPGTKGRLEANQIYNNKTSGVAIQEGADPVVINNKIHDGQDSGVFITGAGTKGRLEGNEIWGNADGGVFIQEGADPTITGRNVIREHATRGGVFVASTAKDKATVDEDTVFERNAAGNVVRK